jgi:hypothetical protein
MLPIGMTTTEPSHRIYAPAGFALALLGGLIVWGTREIGKEMEKELAKPPDGSA